MLEKYKTVYEGGEGEIVEKKSRFIATVRPVQTEEEALAFIEEMKKKYWDARHNCYVYSVGKNKMCIRDRQLTMKKKKPATVVTVDVWSSMRLQQVSFAWHRELWLLQMSRLFFANLQNFQQRMFWMLLKRATK